MLSVFLLSDFEASLDTGIDYTHPALGGGFGSGFKVEGGYDLVGDDYTGIFSSGCIVQICVLTYFVGFNDPVPDNDPLDQCAGNARLFVVSA